MIIWISQPVAMIDEVIKSAMTYLPDLNEARIRKAFAFANKAHAGQLRKDGNAYVTHPVSTAQILTELHVDEDTIVAALLHDVPEDTDYTLDDIKVAFGQTITFLVDGITKLSKVYYRDDMEERQIESLKKLFIHSAQDPRIILIKLADRLHNMSTIDALPNEEKRKRIAKETLEIFVPIANLLGIWELKNRLEDCCFKILCPDDYKMIDDLVKQSSVNKKDLLNKTIVRVKKLLDEKGVKYHTVEGRHKTYFSIFRKMLNGNKSFSEIYDLVGIRIILDDVGLCYQVLGVVHQNFTPKIGRLKDFIAIPKSNGYQSIHTAVFGVEGTITEFQIRTYDMHLENEYGIAAHFFYREAQNQKQAQIQKKLQKKYQWVQKILDLQRDIKSNKTFIKHLKLDIFKDRIFVFTPRGDVVDLPQGSSVIDFAYSIHSDIGMLAESAIINGSPAPLFSRLKSGDVVHVVTSEESEGPQVDWLNQAQTNVAKNRIKEYLKEKDRTSLISEGELLFEDNLKMFGLEGVHAISKLQKVMLMEHFGIESWEEFLSEIGNGGVDINEAVHVIYSDNELIGEEADPISVHAFDSNLGRKIENLLPSKIHRVHLLIHTENRVGLLGRICSQIGDLGINIINVRSLQRDMNERARIEMTLEISDFDRYESALFALRKVPGVMSVTRLHNGQLTEPDQAGFHIGPEQQ